jgi:hypothetical protein
MSKNHDYLKYWKVIRYYVQAKYGIRSADLDMLLFLYSEKYFGKQQFNDFDKLLSWDINRFNRLLSDGWISVFRKRQGNKKTLYELSYKGKRMISSVYKKLNGEEIPMSESANPEEVLISSSIVLITIYFPIGFISLRSFVPL